MIYQDSGKYQEALVFYKLACTRDPRKLGNHREAARIAGILGDHTSRLEALKVLARLQPNNLNVAIERARCLLELQKPKQVGGGGGGVVMLSYLDGFGRMDLERTNCTFASYHRHIITRR